MVIAEVLIAAITAIFGSTGLWTYIQNRNKKRDQVETLVKGLAYNAIVYQTRYYLNRGTITDTEFKDMYNMLYVPYKQMGGNGTAEKLFNEVENLPLDQKGPYYEP